MAYKYLWTCLSHCSEKQLLTLEKVTGKKGILEKVDSEKLRKYISETNFSNLDVSGRPICVIDTLDWEFPFFTFYFFNNVAANIAYCLYKGFLPYVNYIAPKRQINLWEEFMVQPYASKLEEDNNVVHCRYSFAPVYFPNFPSEEDIKAMTNLYQFFSPNSTTEAYFTEEYCKLIEGKRVLGVLCRGTDYTNSWIAGLPKQPTADELIAIVSEKMSELNCDYIYLATEEEMSYRKFYDAFPGRVIQNKREYYDDRYFSLRKTDNEHLLISNITNNRANDGYYRYLEYLSSINLLSKCTALIAGSCGGSRAALYLNRRKYEYSELINKGTF